MTILLKLLISNVVMETQAQFSHIYGKPQNFLAQSLLYTYVYTVELYTILYSIIAIAMLTA